MEDQEMRVQKAVQMAIQRGEEVQKAAQAEEAARDPDI